MQTLQDFVTELSICRVTSSGSTTVNLNKRISRSDRYTTVELRLICRSNQKNHR